MKLSLSLTATLSILSGCTSMDVKPIPASAKLEKICIQFNEEVNVEDFVPVVQEDFFNHGIGSVVYHSDRPKGCEFTMTYAVERWWDFKPYMVDAQMSVNKGEDGYIFDATKCRVEPAERPAIDGRAGLTS
jgi:hypothetical protein